MRTCAHCRRELHGGRSDRRYCGIRCRMRAYRRRRRGLPAALPLVAPRGRVPMNEQTERERLLAQLRDQVLLENTTELLRDIERKL